MGQLRIRRHRRPLHWIVMAALVGLASMQGRPASADGSDGAPSGIAQFPQLFNGYATRPTWKVAGTDYYVGTPAGTALKDPATISMPGVRVDVSTYTVTVFAAHVTLSGYDFGLNGGWQVNVIDDADDITIANSRFAVGANNQMPIQGYYGGSLKVLNNTFDGGGSRGSTAHAMVFAGAGARIQYNRFTDFPDDAIDVTREGRFIIHNNLFDMMGAGDFHTDSIQTYFSPLQDLSIQYNTMYQPPGMRNDGINAFVRIGDQRGHAVRNPVAAYNTIVMASLHATTANIFQWDQDGVDTLINPAIHDNFIDPRGVQYAVIAPMLHDRTTVANPLTYNNVDLSTGKPLLSGPYNSRTNGLPRRAPAPPLITGGRRAGLSDISLAGTAPAASAIAVFDQQGLVGTTQASNMGAWAIVVPLGSDDRIFTARATDAMSNSSALSNSWQMSTSASR